MNSKAFGRILKHSKRKRALEIKGGSSTDVGGGNKVEGADYTRKRWEAQGLFMINGVLHVH